MSLPLNQIVHGDCVEVLQRFPDNCIDLGVTDPPYGLSFMGKKWDKALPPIEAFKELYRVLKPGAIAFVMSSPRQDLLGRMITLLEDSGFDMKQSFISWIYKTGFPKAYDVSQGIENGKYPFGVALRTLFNEETAKTGTPYTQESIDYFGWKAISGLKPALEPILMANKPLSEKTIVDNVLRWGTGAINIDACRIPTNRDNERQFDKENSSGLTGSNKGLFPMGENQPRQDNWLEQGRFPANLVVSDGALDTGEKTGSNNYREANARERKAWFTGRGHHSGKSISPDQYGDVGDQSRFFDLDAWAKHHGFLDVPKPDNKERDFGLKGKKKHNPKGNYQGRDMNNPNNHLGGMQSNFSRNTHPTVKPIKLMSYLIELGCPPDGVVIDPFVGSGTTCIAAKRLCRKYIGIELEESYHVLAQSRVAAYPEPLEWFTK